MSTSPVVGHVGVEPTVLGLKIRCSSDQLIARLVWPGSRATLPTVIFLFYFFILHTLKMGEQITNTK